MSALIMNKFSPDGNTTFDIQDARFDVIQGLINNTDGKYGIEIRDNRLGLQNGGYYEDATLFEEVEQEIQLDNDRNTSYEYTISGIDGSMLDFITNENAVEILLMGEVDGTNEYSQLVRGRFSADELNPEHYIFYPDNQLAYIGKFSELYIDITDSDNPVFTISKDTTQQNTYILSEVAIYLKDYEPVPFPTELVDIDGIYDAIVDKLINDGYIQSQL